MARALDVDGDGVAEVQFEVETAFTARVDATRVTALEVDRRVAARVHGQPITLEAHVPVTIR